MILDPACGSKMFWMDKSSDGVIFGDKRIESHILCDGRVLNVSPSVQMNFMAMPFSDEQFDMVVFDPPHLNKAGENGWQAQKYGVLGENWRDDLATGFSECFRVLRPGGFLVFKWNEVQIKLSEVLSLTPNKPLFGNQRPKASKTHWVMFTKVQND